MIPVLFDFFVSYLGKPNINIIEKLDSLFNMIEKYQMGMGSISMFLNGDEIYQRSIGFVYIEK